MNHEQQHELKDTAVPHELKYVQEWFGSIIRRPLVKNDHINPISPSGVVITKEAARFVSPSPTLQPHQRVEIYNQQYWWRLLNVFQTNFPLVNRLFGPDDFNQKIAIPYLIKYPPDHWSLTILGEKLSQWIEEEYGESDKQLVYDAAQLDQIFAISFLSAQQPALDLDTLSKNDPEALLILPFCLQPHVFLLTYNYDLPAFREDLIKQEPPYWLEHDFPKLPREKNYHFVIFRNLKNNVAWKDIPREEYLLLKQFAKGTSIQSACDWIEEQDTELQDAMVMHLQKWIQDWTRYGWLTLKL
jgi:hypothetical protein